MEQDQPIQLTPVHTGSKKIAARTKIALWLLLGPTMLVVLAFIVFALINLVFNPTFWPTPDTEDFAATPLPITITNIALFVAAAVGMLAWLPGLITGAVLLIKRPKQTS